MVKARPFAPVRALIKLDLPTLLRPRNAISGRSCVGKCDGPEALNTNSETPFTTAKRNALVRQVLFTRLGHFNWNRKRLNFGFQSDSQHLVHRLDEMELHQVANILWDIRQILLIIVREYDFVNAVPVGGKQLLFQAADGQHLAAQGDFTGHGYVAADRNPGERAADGGRDSDTGRGAIFGNRAFGNVQVDVQAAVKIARQPELVRPRSQVAHGRLRRLLHHISQFTGDGELALAFHQRGLGSEDLTAHFRPGQANGRSDFVLLLRLQIAELHGA